MIFSPFLSIPLFFVMLFLLEAGRRFKARTGLEPSTTIENADFALFGLLLAFTFSGAIGRFDDHRKLITEELNTIEAAYRRIDLLPPEAQLGAILDIEYPSSGLIRLTSHDNYFIALRDSMK